MSSGKVHDKVTWYLAIPFFGFCWAFLNSFGESSFCTCSFIFSGLMFGPDLDTKSKQYKRWGFLRFLWIPYQKLGGHRSFLNQSHDSLFGPILRFLYLFCIFGSLALLISYFAKINLFDLLNKLNNSFSIDYLRLLLLFLMGTYIGSLSHQLTDWAYSAKKFYQKIKRRT